jgi:heme oxygenase (biliverdin-IX-beta and delta-forming)
MDDQDLALLRNLLREQRLLSLAVMVEGAPVAGLVPFLASPDLGALVVHVSALARHSQGLGAGDAWSGVVHVPDSSDVDPTQVPRVLLHGRSRRLEDAAVLRAIRQKWLERFPAARMTVDLGDFTFVSLDLEGGRLVGGAGQARNLSREHFARAAGV